MTLLTGLALLVYVLRAAITAAVIVLCIAFALAWLVRTRRIQPFNPVARMVRRLVDPMLLPVERRIVRAGGMPTAAPLWAIAGVIFAGIVAISGLGFILQSVAELVFAAAAGPLGLFQMLVRVTFAILKLAIIIVVLVSWLPISPYSPWVRWAFSITEPIMRPLRQIVPRVAMFDITPIVAYIVLDILEWAFLRL